MCSYNAVNGVPSCANDLINNKIIRNEWGFEGYIVRYIINMYSLVTKFRTLLIITHF